jgi:peptide deformylase
MAVRPIVLYPDPVLLRRTRPVETVDDAVRELIRDLVDTMIAAPGIGLAANQIGEPSRVCVVDLTAGEKPDELHVFVNPEILETEGRQVGEEGCLSFPDIVLEIERAERCRVRALDADGKPFELEAQGLLARAIQHECEHLDGRVFLGNVSALRRELLRKQIRKRIAAGDWTAA